MAAAAPGSASTAASAMLKCTLTGLLRLPGCSDFNGGQGHPGESSAIKRKAPVVLPDPLVGACAWRTSRVGPHFSATRLLPRGDRLAAGQERGARLCRHDPP